MPQQPRPSLGLAAVFLVRLSALQTALDPADGALEAFPCLILHLNPLCGSGEFSQKTGEMLCEAIFAGFGFVWLRHWLLKFVHNSLHT